MTPFDKAKFQLSVLQITVQFLMELRAKSESLFNLRIT